MRTQRSKSRFRHVAARVLAGIFAGGICVLIALWLAFQHKPGWYRPLVLDEAGSQAAKADAVATADDVSGRMVQGRPFEVTLSDRSVNEWLAALPQAWPDAKDAMPPELSDPALRFDCGEVRIGAHYTGDAWEAIVSVGATLRVSDNGSGVEIALTGAYGGSLPVPRAILSRLFEELSRTLPAGHASPGEAGDPLTAALRKVQSTDELFEGVTIRNRFIWFNGDRPFRIESLTIEEGILRLRIEPL